MSRKSKRRQRLERQAKRAEVSKTLTWRVYPFVEHWMRSALAVGVTIVLTIAVRFLAPPEEPFYVGVPLFMFIALNGYFLPTTYVLSGEGIEVKRLFRIHAVDWGRFRSFNYDDEGALLSPYEVPTRRAMFRTLTLLFDKSRKQEILEYLRQRLKDVKAQSTPPQ
jgi:hypothetical protein